MAGWQCMHAPASIHLPRSSSDNRLKRTFSQTVPHPCRPAAASACLQQHNTRSSSPQQATLRAVHAPAVEHDHSVPEAGSGGGSGGSNRTWPWGRDGSGDGAGGDHFDGLPASLLQQLLAVLSLVLLSMLLPAPSQAAAAASKRSGLVSKQDERMESSWQLDAFVDRMWDLSSPIINNMGFSGLVGACAAAALKWVGRTLAASLGIGLLLVQVLSHYNIISVNWSVVHRQARQVLDTTGDGRLDQNDFKRVVKQGLVIMSEGVPSLSGFLVGFLVGIKVF